MVTEIEVTEVGRDDRGPFVIADGSLWVDGKRVYKPTGLGIRIVAGPPVLDPPGRFTEPKLATPADE
ncbi:MAG TPA: hypothetical protein VME46_04050 [Acidimicrobiales bacterium]|nr:hypothetical protein [Acidimicrobiales bacterium]